MLTAICLPFTYVKKYFSQHLYTASYNIDKGSLFFSLYVNSKPYSEKTSWQTSVPSGFKDFFFLKRFPSVLPKHVLSIFQGTGGEQTEN